MAAIASGMRDEQAVQPRPEQPADEPGADQPRAAHHQQEQRERRDVDARDRLEERPQVGEQRELPEEEAA